MNIIRNISFKNKILKMLPRKYYHYFLMLKTVDSLHKHKGDVNWHSKLVTLQIGTNRLERIQKELYNETT
jgi:hypothetical protein